MHRSTQGDYTLGIGKPQGYVHMDEKRKIFPTSFLSFFLTFRDAGILTNYGHHTSAELQLLHLNILKSHLAR